MGFDGKRSWVQLRGKDASYLSAEKSGDKADIDRLEQARDILRYLLLPDLIRDGKPFKRTGTVGPSDKPEFHVLKKRDHKGRPARSAPPTSPSSTS